MAASAPAATRVRDDAYELEARRLIRTGLLVVLALVLGAGVWMAITPLSGAAIAQGSVKVDMNRKTLQHQEGGIVKEILVRDGSRVEVGQTLLVINDVRVEANYDLLVTQLDSELAKASRLSAENTLEGSVAYADELLARAADARVKELMRRENAVFTTRRQMLDSQIKLLKEQIVESRREAAALGDQVQAEKRAVQWQQEELQANRKLAEEGFMSNTKLLSLQRGVAEYDARLGEHQATLAQAHQRAGDFELRIASLRNAYMKEAADELKDATAKIYDLRERLRPSLDAAQRQKVVAPVAGEVVDLRVTTIGAVVGPREPLLDIVPANPELIVEARVRPEDITYVKVGGDADVRLSAFKQRITPTVSGKVTYVSADSLSDPKTGATYYVVHVRLTADALREAGDLRLQAGMPAEVFVKTPARTPLQYLLDPVTGFLQRSFREP
ncbi:MAG TPA: HlyD family type I secretion periplasmic adaptor subunit [Burkholderiales bacterium]|nr:HlyD family type I secretion periplasmic adaptor subunit [Burkholderiales bacterium]